MRKFVIYKITNLVNGKIYIGKTSRFEKRKKGYYQKSLGKYKKESRISKSLITQALQKYGFENFKFEIIEEVLTPEILNEREKFWIRTFNSVDKSIGYNIALGGNGGDLFTNHPNKEAYREKIVKATSGKNNKMYGRSVYSVWVEKYGKDVAEIKYSDWKKNIKRGHSLKSEEQKSEIGKRISKSTKGRAFSQTHRVNLSEHNKIRFEKENILSMLSNGMTSPEISNNYNVSEDTLNRKLSKWGFSP